MQEGEVAALSSQMLARAIFLRSLWRSSSSNFYLGPSPSDSTERVYEIWASDLQLFLLFIFLESKQANHDGILHISSIIIIVV